MTGWFKPKSNGAVSTFVLVTKASLLLATMILVGCNVNAQTLDTEAFVDWATESGLVVDNLDEPLEGGAQDALQKASETAQVVGLGESRHDTREQCLF